MNWQDPDVTEILIGARGICQGKKPKTLADFQKLRSRLSRQSIVQQSKDSLPIEYQERYQALKVGNADPNWKLLKAMVFAGGPLSGWVQEKNDYSLKGAIS